MPLLSIIGPWSGSLGVPSNSAHNGLGDWGCLLKIVGEENYPPGSRRYLLLGRKESLTGIRVGGGVEIINCCYSSAVECVCDLHIMTPLPQPPWSP